MELAFREIDFAISVSQEKFTSDGLFVDSRSRKVIGACVGRVGEGEGDAASRAGRCMVRGMRGCRVVCFWGQSSGSGGDRANEDGRDEISDADRMGS